MKVPSARSLFKTYVAVLVGLAFVGLALVGLGADGFSDAWRGGPSQFQRADPASGFATAVSFRGPAPGPARAGAAVGAGESFFYGPLTPGECLPPFDVVALVPTFGFHGAGAVFNFGRARGDGFDLVASFATLPEPLPADVRYLQVCFPSGIDHEQVLWLAPRRAGEAVSPFLGQPTIAPPPLHRTPADVSVQLGRTPGGHGALGARTVFNTIGRLCEVSVEGDAPVLIELGEIEEGWRFVVHDTLRVAAGETRRAGEPVRWPHFRVVLPEDGGRAHLSIAHVPES